MQMIGEKKNNQVFCVKYSDFCKCKNCQIQRNKVDNIGPVNQQNQSKNPARRESAKRPQTDGRTAQKEEKSPRPILKNSKAYKGDKCLPFSQLYAHDHSIQTVSNAYF